LSVLQLAQLEARKKITKPTDLQRLERWWSTKYKLPSNHKLFQERSFFEHLVEYFEDYYTNNPVEANRNEDGIIQFKDTGDPLLDKWNEEIAEGKAPDFWEAFSEESKNIVLERLEKAKRIGYKLRE
jgi:hypothetical protein